MNVTTDQFPRRKALNIPKHRLYSKRWLDPSYSNRNFNAARRQAREEYSPLFPNHVPAKWNGTLTLK
tara:strand:- start:421 stop:621 length:201 start_codon:yes stop_codon:yes gene_type:complete